VTSIALTNDALGVDVTSTRYQAIVVRLINAQGQGVEAVKLRVAREDLALSLELTTGADGFTAEVTRPPEEEDGGIVIPSLPPEQRGLVGGTWRLDVLDGVQPSQVGDVLWYFVYELP
jgi:hypothetical protein